MTASREKFKASKLVSLQDQEQKMYNQVYSNNEKTDYLQITKGSNRIRIFPGHPDSDTFIMPYGRWWLPREVKDKDGKIEIKKRPVFYAKIHGGLKKDVVEEYIKFATKFINDQEPDANKVKIALEKLTHWKTGLKLKPEWVFYAKKITGSESTFGLMTVSNGIKNKLNELAISEDSEDGPIETDPFTDPDTGKCILINYNPDAEGRDMYKVSLEWRKDSPLDDKELEDFEQLKSLNELFTDIYKHSDFNLALEGLRIFDRENNFDIFDLDDWHEVVENLAKELPDAKSETDDDESDDDESEDKIEDKNKSEISFEKMSREELKKYISDNEINISVRKNMTEKQIVDAIKAEIEAEKLFEKEDKEELKKSNNMDDIRQKLGLKK